MSFFDTDNGEKWLNRAAEWFDNVQKFDKGLKDFELPESVRKVSQPPKEERYKDRWTNIKLSQPKSGQFFNRRSCSWYWNSKRKDVTLLQGLVAFAKEDYETAEKHWNLLAELDKEFYAQQKASGWENATTLARLLWSVKNKQGSLYARPEEMVSFTIPKRRLAIWLADFYYMSERPQDALSIYRRLESAELGRMTKNETAYVTCGVFACMCWDKKLDEIKYIEPKLKHFIGTPCEARILLGYANRLNTRDEEGMLKKQLQIYEYLVKKHSGSEEADFADFATGMAYLRLSVLTGQNQNHNDSIQWLDKARNHFIIAQQRIKNETYHKEIQTILKNITSRTNKSNGRG
ncbi:MAG: hypothetical protein LBG58_02880 [Planctomycetaceae bacterium]|nr:hypothetical protein [Planctomycetaceae bacterium]